MPSTIKDIAKALGFAPSTVSRALNNSPQISEETRTLIHTMAKRMNYRLNRSAAGLRTQKTYCLGLVVPSISSHFFSTVISGVQQVASANGYQLLICQTKEDEKEERNYVDALISGRIDGLMISVANGTKNYDHIKLAMEEMPVVMFDRVTDKIDGMYVEAKDYEGSYKATTHLIKRGCKNIAHLAGPKDLMIAKNRMNGYKAALKDNKIKFDKKLVAHCDFDKDLVPNALQQVFRQNPKLDGIFAANDEVAVQAIIELRKLKMKVPEQVAIVGFGNYPIAEIVEPTLTTVKHHPRRIGANATHKLLSMIDSSYTDYEEEFITSDLIKRGSA